MARERDSDSLSARWSSRRVATATAATVATVGAGSSADAAPSDDSVSSTHLLSPGAPDSTPSPV